MFLINRFLSFCLVEQIKFGFMSQLVSNFLTSSGLTRLVRLELLLLLEVTELDDEDDDEPFEAGDE